MTPEEDARIERAAKAAAKKAKAALSLPDIGEAAFLADASLYTMEHLAVWQHPVPDTRHALLPSQTSYPNPLILDDLVIACVCSKGQIVAVDKATGELRWHLPLPYWGDSHAYAAEGRVYGGTSEALLCIDPADGQVLWQFQPYSEGTERIYSSPVCVDGRVFIGDRRGVFSCLSAENGMLLWNAQTAQGRNCDVNATALLYEDLVITATNAKLVLAYEQRSGKEVWRQSLPEICTGEVRFYAGMILAATHLGLYGLSPQTGEIVHTWGWKDHEIEFVTVADEVLCVVLTNEYRMRNPPKKKPTIKPKINLLGLHNDVEQWRLSYPLYAEARLCWDRQTGLVYEATQWGLGMVDPRTGRRLALIRPFGVDESVGEIHQTGLPSIEAGALYVLSRRGLLARLRHPKE